MDELAHPKYEDFQIVRLADVGLSRSSDPSSDDELTPHGKPTDERPLPQHHQACLRKGRRGSRQDWTSEAAQHPGGPGGRDRGQDLGAFYLSFGRRFVVELELVCMRIEVLAPTSVSLLFAFARFLDDRRAQDPVQGSQDGSERLKIWATSTL